MPTPGKSEANPSPSPPVPGKSIWNPGTIYSPGTEQTDPQLECSTLAVKCERVFHTTSNSIIENPLPDIEKGKCYQCFNKEMETIALDILKQVREAEYLQKHSLTEGTFTLSKEEIEAMCSTEGKKTRKKKEKEMLVELMGEDDATKLRRKWRSEKKKEKQTKPEKKKRDKDQGKKGSEA
ncbi:hypothetical protein L211DRAFT_844646 [Terfezia boudieri ATCC MYA-4762]|uniref:Uncharacterized protein n=1 Tax=Terfezia boudieri ATCC MYA-4762 TaxID=1051890 RepID=A0A3N4M3X8_9PEZI|nr:hypothetical protein L211DRAFT_844646 [Terfezia boudieri ATCC MYA-4762]